MSRPAPAGLLIAVYISVQPAVYKAASRESSFCLSVGVDDKLAITETSMNGTYMGRLKIRAPCDINIMNPTVSLTTNSIAAHWGPVGVSTCYSVIRPHPTVAIAPPSMAGGLK